MKYSDLFGRATKNEPQETKFVSHYLLYKAGFIRESTAGRYYFLPLGWRVHRKIKNIIRQEMNRAGAQEMLAPVLHPLELWEETNRTDAAGFELTAVTDRRGAKFALGGTAEEMFVDLVRKFQLSYKDLPFNLYQFSTKFRDELRARGGLLRVREFTMKDAYSFHPDEADFQRQYELMTQTYFKIFEKLDLEVIKVAADNGYIGGDYCHEFQVESSVGEGRFFVNEAGQYLAHEDVAQFYKEDKNVDETLKAYQEVEAERGPSMEAGVKLHDLPLWQQIKNVLFFDEKDRPILAIIRGDLSVNEIKLAHLVEAHRLRPATEEEVRALGTEPGFISPVNLDEQVLIVADDSLRTLKNAYGGANQKNLDAININIDRDYQPDLEGDIALAQAGFLSPKSQSPLIEKSGIEVGNIFQLGHHYSKLMQATFTDQTNQNQPFYMGCYGIGLGRTLASIVETHHDEAGIIWPVQLAPFSVHLISLPGGEEQAQRVYQDLTQAGFAVLWDDRAVSAGEKFADADLIGNPVRLVSSDRTGKKLEWKRRTETATELLSLTEVKKRLTSLINSNSPN